MALHAPGSAFSHVTPPPSLRARLSYTYNEVAMLALNNVNPVTHAVANTIKRVVILLACVIFFKTPMTYAPLAHPHPAPAVTFSNPTSSVITPPLRPGHCARLSLDLISCDVTWLDLI